VKHKAVALIAALLVIAVTIVLVMAYKGPTTAVDANKDYSKASRPTAQVLSSTVSDPQVSSNSTVKPSTVTPVLSSHPPTNPVSKSTSASTNATTPAITQEVVVNAPSSTKHSSDDKTTSTTTKKSGDGLLQGLITVVSNIQL